MEPLRGRLSDKPLAILMRELAAQGRTGHLCLTQGEGSRSIFFTAGVPTYAYSTVPSEQIDHKLIKEGKATAGLVETARRKQPAPELIGGALVEIGVITEDVFRA